MVSDIIIGVIISGIFFVLGIITTIVGSQLSQKINHKNKIEYRERELILTWKKEEFERVSKEINSRIENYKKIINKLYSEKYIREDILENFDKSFKQDLEVGSFLNFSKELLDSTVKFHTSEMSLGILIKEKLKNKQKINQIEFTKLILELKIERIHIFHLMRKDLKI